MPDNTETKNAEQLATEFKAQIDKKHGEVQRIAEDALKEAKQNGTINAELKAKADENMSALNVLREQLTEIEQKMARRPGSDETEVKSYGEQVVSSDAYKAFKESNYSEKTRFSLKAITAAQTGTNWSQRDNEVVGLQKRTLTIRDLLNVVPTDSSSIDYAKQTTRTNNAAPVAEAAAKPYSAYVWTQMNIPIRTIAHLAKITRQALDDSKQLAGEVESEMNYGLKIVEEAQLLSGDGTGNNLAGMIPQATDFLAPITVADATMIDNLRLGLLQAELALYPTDGIILNPADWAGIELTKTTEGAYIFANPLQLAGPRLWSKPVVSTVAMTIDKFLVGGFKLQTLYDRMQPEVLISSENADDFEKNLYTMRCEERLALAVKRPGALIRGDFGQVA